MDVRRTLLGILLACVTPIAFALQPIRILGAGFEPGDPARDCATDAVTEAALADLVATPDGSGLCIDPFFEAGLEICGGVSAQCQNGGCFVPLGPGGSTVDAVAGQVAFADPMGQAQARFDHPVLPDCIATFTFTGATLDLRYQTAHDGLDGLVLGGLAQAPAAQLTAPTVVAGCPGFNSVMPQITQVMRGRVLEAYVAATLTRIGDPLDAAVCPIVRP